MAAKSSTSVIVALSTMQCYASAVYAVVMFLSVHPGFRVRVSRVSRVCVRVSDRL